MFSDDDIERVERRAAAAAGDSALAALEELSAAQRVAIEGRVSEDTEYESWRGA